MTSIDYARVYTPGQDTALQIDALKGVGCGRIFEDQASGARTNRPVLTKALSYVRYVDVLVV